MAKPQKSKTQETDVRPDAWDRFERAVDVAANHSPLHKPAKPHKAASRSRTATAKKTR